MKRRVWFLVMAVTAVCLAGCSDPERIEHRPVAGIDTMHREDVNPYDEVTGQLEEPFLKSFNEQLVAELKESPGRVAVFPALSWSPNVDGNIVNGLGEHMADLTATALETAGMDVIARSQLVSAIHGANQWLRSYGSPADALALADILGAEYVVTGVASLKVLNPEKRDESLDIDWICYRVEGREIVTRYKKSLPSGALAKEIIRYYGADSEWQTLAGREQLPANP